MCIRDSIQDDGSTVTGEVIVTTDDSGSWYTTTSIYTETEYNTLVIQDDGSTVTGEVIVTTDDSGSWYTTTSIYTETSPTYTLPVPLGDGFMIEIKDEDTGLDVFLTHNGNVITVAEHAGSTFYLNVPEGHLIVDGLYVHADHSGIYLSEIPFGGWSISSISNIFIKRADLGTLPVSYTHLDVYKRQLLL